MRVLLADDESLIRLSLRKYLIELGIRAEDIVEATDGEEMIRLLEQTSVDIALVDIRMPNLSGLEAIDRLGQVMPNTAFYLLTGFGDFEYAQRAIRLGIKEYLLKPLSREKLQALLDKEQDALAQRQARSQKQLEAHLHALLAGWEEAQPVTYIPIVVFGSTADPRLIPALTQWLQQHTGHTVLAVFYQEYPYLLIVQSDAFSPSALPPLSYPVSLICGHPCPENALLPVLKSLAQSAPLALFCAAHRSLAQEDLAANYTNTQIEISRLFAQLLISFGTKDFVQFNATVALWKNKLSENSLHHSRVDWNNLIQWCQHCFQLPAVPISTPGELSALLKESAEKHLLPGSPPKDLIEQVLSYVQTHYGEDISISSIAALFSLTPNYLTTLFKNKTNTGFVKYLTQVRLQNAKRLLRESSLPIREIAASCGYYSVSYFIKVFSAAEGCTPIEYRQSEK